MKRPFVLVLLITLLLSVTLLHTPLQAESPYDESSAAVAELDLTPVAVKSNTLEKPVGQDEPPSDPETLDLSDPTNPLSADALNPPETCGVPEKGLFGEDAELLLLEDPQTLRQLEATPAWKASHSMGLSSQRKPISGISAVATNSGKVLAVWAGNGDSSYGNDIDHAIWAGTWDPVTRSGLYRSEDLGNPVALALEPEKELELENMGFFVRHGNLIYCENYGAEDWEGIYLPGMEKSENAKADSDPAVVARDPQHVAVFFRSGDGGIWFTESYGSGAVCTGVTWRGKPISLSGVELEEKEYVYLPVLSSTTSAPKLNDQVNDTPLAASSIYPAKAKPTFTLASDLSAASRNDNHLAVFGVNDQNELWVKEWTNLNESDWRDTEWVKLMDGVAIERPSVVSRHSNHLGVAIRAQSHKAVRYIEWSTKSGWKTPQSLGKGGSSDLSAPVTLAATAKDAMSLFSVQQGQIWYRNWDEDAQWGAWQKLEDMTVQASKALTAVVRGPHEFMLLGIDPNNDVVTKQFTSFGHDLVAGQQLSGDTATGHRGQTLAWVDGEMLFAVPNSSGAQWQVDITSLVDKESISYPLPLTDHAKSADNSSDHALAAADLDQDGNDELVFVSAPQVENNWQIDISVLDVEVSPTLVAGTITSIFKPIDLIGDGSEPSIVWDVNVAIGDLDGDAVQDDVVVAFYPYCQIIKVCQVNRNVIVELFEFDPQTKKLKPHGEGKTIKDAGLGCKEYRDNRKWCQMQDLAIAIGRVDLDVRERLIIADLLYQAWGDGYTYTEPSFLNVYGLPTDNDGKPVWELDSNFLVDTTIKSVTSQTVFTLDAGSSDDDAYNDQYIVLYDASNINTYAVRKVHDYTGSTKTITLNSDPGFTLDVGDFIIIGSPWEADNWVARGSPGDHRNPDKIHKEHIALGTGDIDADGIEEIAHIGDGRDQSTLYVVELDADKNPQEVARQELQWGWYEDHDPSMAVGDINQDGRADIALVPPGDLQKKTSLYQLVGGKLLEKNHYLHPDYHDHYVLMGDLDNDSFVSKLKGCKKVSEVTVVAVLNGPPRWYDDDGNPVQEISVEYAKTKEMGTGTEDGTSTSFGASLSIGMEVETDIPFGGPTFGVRASIENETMVSWGYSHETESSVSVAKGYSTGGEGLVIFNELDYMCNIYDVYSPVDPQKKSTAMACYPVPCGKLCPNEEFASLEKWHKVIKLSAGDSWVDLGHKSAAGDITNLVTTYPNTEPYDPEMVMFEMKKNPLKIEYDPEDEGTFQGWNWTKAEGGARAQTRSFENNTTLSRGVTLGYATLDTSMTFGIGGESSRSVTWAKELGISSEIAQFTEPEYQCYKAAPYLHHAKARTLGGNTYPYLELAWWVPEIYDCN